MIKYKGKQIEVRIWNSNVPYLKIEVNRKEEEEEAHWRQTKC
jgi:hypothetical protein